jgi:hypothetical protein
MMTFVICVAALHEDRDHLQQGVSQWRLQLLPD